MTDETPPDLLEPDVTEEDPEDVLALLDRLEELVGVGRRMPFSTRVMVEEEEFLGLLDQIRAAVPREIRHAQRVVEERADIITSAQHEAAKILDHARTQAEYIISEQGVMNEARQRGEEYCGRWRWSSGARSGRSTSTRCSRSAASKRQSRTV